MNPRTGVRLSPLPCVTPRRRETEPPRGVTTGSRRTAMKRILVCTLLALGTAAFAGAATQDPALVAGRVTDPSGAPVAGALVRITELSVGTSTRADGRYRL